MSRNYTLENKEALYFVTFTIVNWIDLFTRIEYKNIIVDSLNYCIKNKGLNVYAWVIMTNHMHLVVSTVIVPSFKLETIVAKTEVNANLLFSPSSFFPFPGSRQDCKPETMVGI